MNRDAAIEAGQAEILTNWSMWVTSPRSARNMAAAVLDAAAPHLVGEPVGYLTLNPDGWVIAPHVRGLADEQRTVQILNETYGPGHYRVVALVRVEDQP